MISDHLFLDAGDEAALVSPLQSKRKRKREPRYSAQWAQEPRRDVGGRRAAAVEKSRHDLGAWSADANANANANANVKPAPTKRVKRKANAQAAPPASRRDVDEAPQDATTTAKEKTRWRPGRARKKAKTSLALQELSFHANVHAKLFNVCLELTTVLDSLDDTLSIPALFLDPPRRRTTAALGPAFAAAPVPNTIRVPLGAASAIANTAPSTMSASVPPKFSFQAALEALNRGISAATASADALLLNCRKLTPPELPGTTQSKKQRKTNLLVSANPSLQLRPEVATAAKSLKKKTGSTSDFFIADPFSKDPTPPGLAFTLQPSHYGLIQERICDSLWALVVQAILWNQTTGKAGRPVLFMLLSHYPTPQSIAAANTDSVFDIIGTLGLGKIRSERLIKLAQTWVAAPPDPSRRYGKRNYPHAGDNLDVKDGELLPEDDERTGWEIAHLPGVGPYALDSFRIFYRDKLRGIGSSGSRVDENGKKRRGRPSKKDVVEPEWKRVVPVDKDLAPYVKWRWRQEGWEWDMATGKRTKMVE